MIIPIKIIIYKIIIIVSITLFSLKGVGFASFLELQLKAGE